MNILDYFDTNAEPGGSTLLEQNPHDYIIRSQGRQHIAYNEQTFPWGPINIKKQCDLYDSHCIWKITITHNWKKAAKESTFINRVERFIAKWTHKYDIILYPAYQKTNGLHYHGFMFRTEMETVFGKSLNGCEDKNPIEEDLRQWVGYSRFENIYDTRTKNFDYNTAVGGWIDYIFSADNYLGALHKEVLMGKYLCQKYLDLRYIPNSTNEDDNEGDKEFLFESKQQKDSVEKDATEKSLLSEKKDVQEKGI